MSLEHPKLVSEQVRRMKDIAATPTEVNNAADVSGRVQTLTASGAVTAGKQSVQLNLGTTVIIAATIADASNHQGLFIAKDISTGTAAHTLTLTSGTWNAAGNTVATFNAADEALIVYFDSTGAGTLIANVGSVAMS